MKKILLQTILACTIALSASAQDEVYLDSVVGLNPENGGINADFPIEFVFNFRIEFGNLTGCTNGKRFYSPDGATWQPLVQTTNPILTDFLDGGVFTLYFSVTGTGSDTVGFGAFALFAGGVPVGYDGWVKTIHTMVSSDDIGKTLCIDSSFMPPQGIWLWSLDNGSVSPAWAGPHCFEIVDCCTGMRGDFNYDGNIDITDITEFVSWFHLGGEAPICVEEGNIDGNYDSGLPITTRDLSYYVGYLFKGGPPPAACP